MTATTTPRVAELDLDDGIGQRSATYRFALINGVTGQILTDLTPIRNTVPILTHDTSRTIKRQIQGLNLGRDDTARINVVTDRVLPYMVLGGVSYPLGRYMFADTTARLFTSGNLSDGVLLDEMNIVDQQLEKSYSATVVQDGSGDVSSATLAQSAVTALLAGLPITTSIEPSPFYTIGSWAAGTNRGQPIDDLSIDGDWFSPWFDNDGVMTFVRTFDPATVIPTFDFDTGNKVFRNSITLTNDLLDAPNRFIVISNGAVSASTAAIPLVGTYDVPTSAPHSIANRGFVIPSVEQRQIDTQAQVDAAARNLGQRQTIFERTTLATAPDPRHDGYDVIRWQGANWLEIGWSLPLAEGAAMTHTMRKSYL
jgi:hypothetical protein